LVAGNAIGTLWKIDLAKFTENVLVECINKARPYYVYVREHRICKDLIQRLFGDGKAGVLYSVDGIECTELNDGKKVK